MGRNRTPESQEKRRRELEQQPKRQARMTRRLEKNAQKRTGREGGGPATATTLVEVRAVAPPSAGQP